MTTARSRAVLVLVAAGLISETAVGSRQQKPSQPNVLLIQADDLGYGDLSAYGQARFSTPALDRLGKLACRNADGCCSAITGNAPLDSLVRHRLVLC